MKGPVQLRSMTWTEANAANTPGLVTAGGHVLLNRQPLRVTECPDPINSATDCERLYFGNGTDTIADIVSDTASEYFISRRHFDAWRATVQAIDSDDTYLYVTNTFGTFKIPLNT